MSSKAPPVPPDQQSQRGASSTPGVDQEVTRDPAGGNAHLNLKEQGEEGNTRQNTTHQGRQQDR